MKPTTIRQLNQMNIEFYKTVAESFAQTRSQPWAGWMQLVPFLTENLEIFKKLTVLDIGCGNGRFGEFLATQFPEKILYHGIDSNAQLLSKAQANLAQKAIPFQLQNIDIVESLLTHSFLKEVDFLNTQVVTLFGVLHHIPGFQMRSQLLREIVENIPSNALIIIATWQFDTLPNLFARKLESSTLHLSHLELEENDYFLNWERNCFCSSLLSLSHR
jgi:tRNA (uracil-5-)-methyltransferase TRM9